MTQTSVATAPIPALDNKDDQPLSPTFAQDAKQSSEHWNFDPEELTRRYNEERDKRLQHNGGLEQYQTVKGELSYLLKDPWIIKRLEREPIQEQCEVLVIGGGYGAQLVAVELLKQGITDIRIIEKGGDFGGTWYWSKYPGAQCDIESYVYMPLLEEMGYVPTQKYANHKELLEHAQAIGKKFGLYDKALFQTEVLGMCWREETARWDVGTDRNDYISARFVIPAAGPLHRPKLPGLPGLNDFKGHMFHTSRWDYNYTGGDPDHPPEQLDRLSDKRVGVIGTGATAVQIVPFLGKWAQQLYVFQRTPSSIDVRGNKTTDPAWVESLGPHWQRDRMDNFNIIVNGGQQDEDLVSDGWTDLLRKLVLRKKDNESSADQQNRADRRQMLDFEKMEQIRARVDNIVKDHDTAESLKPWYNQFCKRPCFHDEYLPTFNRPNVELVDTLGKGVERITEKGIVANGKEYEIDCLVFATGFELATSWTQKSGIEIYGRNHLSLGDKWADGPSTLHGHSTRDFPNLFFVMNTQSALSPNFLHVTAFQAKHLAYIVERCKERDIRSVEPTQEAEDAWVETIVESKRVRGGGQIECTPGYYNNEGQSSRALDKRSSYGGGALKFMAMMDEWREKDTLDGLELKPWDTKKAETLGG